MKQILSLFIISLLYTSAFAQEINKEIPTHYMMPTFQTCSPIESPAYLDSTLFARYLNWHLQPDSLPTNGKPKKGETIEIWYIVSKEGKISFAKSKTNEENECVNFILHKFLNCPYQWTPAYRNGRAVNYYSKMRVVF